MRFRLIAVLALLIVLASMSAFADNVVNFTGTPAPSVTPTFGNYINFQSYMGGAMDPNTYASQGVTISDTETLYYTPLSGVNSVSTYNLNNGSGDPTMALNSTFTFTNPMKEIGIGLAQGDATVTLYGTTDNVLATYNIGDTSGNSIYELFVDQSGADIASMNITSSSNAFDDMQYTATPEPSTCFLLGTGLLSFGAAIRRKWAL